MKKILYPIAFLIHLITVTNCVLGQIAVTGATCVIPGVSYQYNLTGSWDSTSTMKVCIAGGTIMNVDSSRQACTPEGPPLGAVLVTWNNLNTGSLSVTTDKGNASLNVSITTPLTAGIIDSSSATQVIDYSSIPATIMCSQDNGGSCSPIYLDQWQQSYNQLNWTDIQGATSQNLIVTSPLTQPTFYRRKVTEQKSGTIAYSDVAFVDVRPASALLLLNRNHDSYYNNIAFNREESKVKPF